jgi:hypothetical protein
MQPIGQHIKISSPEPVNKSQFIVEKERVQKARVADISFDVTVPFKKLDTVFFNTGKEIILDEEIFLNIEVIVGYE